MSNRQGRSSTAHLPPQEPSPPAAALSPEQEANTPLPRFRVAYIARATIPGTFALPASFLEDMYAPKVLGRTAMGSVTIAAQ